MIEYTSKTIVREQNDSIQEAAEISADLVLDEQCNIIKDRHGVVQRAVMNKLKWCEEQGKSEFIKRTAAQCLAGMMANSAREHGDHIKGSAMEYGDDDALCFHAANLAHKLWDAVQFHNS